MRRVTFRMAVLWALVTSLNAGSAAAQMVKLDTPVIRVRTVRLEIQRGDADARQCALGMKDGKSASEYLLCGIGKKKLDRYNGETQDFYTFGSYIATFNELEIIALTSAGDAPGSHGDPPPTDVIATMKSLLDQIAILHHLKMSDYCEAVVSWNMAKCKASPLY